MTDQPVHDSAAPAPDEDQSDPTVRVREQTANDLGSTDAFDDEPSDGPG